MKATFRTLLGLLAAAVMLPGCGGSQNSALPQAVEAQSRVHGASDSSGDLLYAAAGFHLSIYSFPDLKRLKIVNTWPNALGLWTASDISTGDMCFDNYSQVYVYQHGATQPYVTIPEPSSGESFDCAFDSSTNDLAITYNEDNGPYYVSIYKSPYDGGPSNYTDSNLRYIKYAAYDADGDLFVDGQDENGCECRLFELPKGASNFIELQRNYQLTAGPLQWDGQYMTMAVQSVLYRFTVSGSSVTVVGKTAYQKVTSGDAFAIRGNTAMGWVLHKGVAGKFRHIGFWRYPKGTKPFRIIKVFTRAKDLDWGAGIPVISVAPSR